MGTKLAISEDEYLHLNAESPFPDYIDGDLVERAMPNDLHSESQVELVYHFRSRRDENSIYARSEIRLRVGPGKYRVADFAAFTQRPQQLVPEITPLVVAEIVSPDDNYNDLRARLRDYHALGVPHVWLVDPIDRSLSLYDGVSLTEVPAVEVPEIGLRLTLDQLIPARS